MECERFPRRHVETQLGCGSGGGGVGAARHGSLWFAVPADKKNIKKTVFLDDGTIIFCCVYTIILYIYDIAALRRAYVTMRISRIRIRYADISDARNESVNIY